MTKLLTIMMNPYIRKALPHVAAIAFFALITLAYVYPVLEGKKLFQPDIANHIGMSKEIKDFNAKTGEVALWTNSMFGGMPAYQISVKFRNNISHFFHRALTLGLPRPADMIFLYFIGFYILLLVLGLNPWLAIAGAIGFAFSSYHFIILEAGHNSKAVAIAYMAPVLAGIILAWKGQIIKGGLLTAIFLSLQINANHFQVTYYLLIIVIITGIAFLINALRTKQFTVFIKASGVLILAALLSLSLNFANLWTTWEYSKYTIRGGSELTHNNEIQTSTGLDKDYATRWSYGIAETFSLLVPNVKGGSSDRLGNNPDALDVVDREHRTWVGNQNQYFGEQPFTSGPVYVGAIVLFLFLVGAFIVRGPLKWALLAAALLSIVLAWGRNFMPVTDFFLDYVPGYNKFRAVSMTLIIAELCIPLLAFLALKEIVAQPGIIKERARELIIALGLTGGIALAFYIAPTLFFGFSSVEETKTFLEYKATQPDMSSTVDTLWHALETARISIFKADALRSFLFIILSAGLLWAYGFGKIKQTVFIGILTLLILVDMWPVNRRYLTEENFVSRRQVENPYKPNIADQLILKDVDPNYRVLNLTTNTFNETSTSYFHKSIGGYHGAKLQRYQDLIDHHITKGNIRVLSMLNTKYIIKADKDKAPVPEINMQAMGNAWFVSRYKIAENADEEIEALNSLDIVSEAVVDKHFLSHVEGKIFAEDSLSTIFLTSYTPNRLVYKANTATSQIAVFSEVFYDKGWNAFIDGKPRPHFRVNYILRAMEVPAGQHEIEFRFEPRSYYWGQKVSLAGSIILLLLMLAYGLKQFKGSQKAKTN
ncbi:MAG: YfhO family protein [Bacteroidales bacterium]|nr:YfhO family protein [Bacteroidales bacterium]